jgi:hypothetical protein
LTIAQIGFRIIERDSREHSEPTIMEPIRELADAIYRERVLRARRTPIEQKLLAGAELFESACQVTCDGIRHQNPGIEETEVQRILRDRLALARRLGR